jgi:hypothetical protein
MVHRESQPTACPQMQVLKQTILSQMLRQALQREIVKSSAFRQSGLALRNTNHKVHRQQRQQQQAQVVSPYEFYTIRMQMEYKMEQLVTIRTQLGQEARRMVKTWRQEIVLPNLNRQTAHRR